MGERWGRDVATPSGAVTHCGSCGCGDLTTVLDLGWQPLPQATPGKPDSKLYPLRLVRCPRCTLVQLDYIVPQTELFPPEYPYTTGNTKALRQHFASQAQEVASYLNRGDLAIDIGGNDGTMLNMLRAAAPDARLMLIEPTDQADKCDDESIMVVKAYFTETLAAEIAEANGVAQVVTASNVFGHVPDPHEFLHGVDELLAPDGTLIIDNQDWYNVVQDGQIDTVYHEHLRYYSPSSLTWLLSRHGLLLTSWNRIGMHGGSFRAVAVRETPDLGRRANQLLIRLHHLVQEAAAEGPVYAVTAPTRATPLVNASGIGEFLTCACEITGSEKIGATIPGTTVPIVDEERLFKDQPPTVILLAWDLRAQLIPMLRDRGYRGDIIVPLPQPHTDRVVDDDC